MTGKWTASLGRRVALGGWGGEEGWGEGRGRWGVKVRGKGRRCQEELQVWAVFFRGRTFQILRSRRSTGELSDPRRQPHSLSVSGAERDGRGDVAPS